MIIYDTNLSYRLQVGIGRYTLVIDWWYDAGMRMRRYMPVEMRLYGTKRHLKWVAEHAARFKASQEENHS